MSRTPEKADAYGPREPGCTCEDGFCGPHGVLQDVTCPSVSAFPGEPTYHCWKPSDCPHKLHDDGEHHRWFEAIPDLPISSWQADWLEQIGALSFDGTRPGLALGFMMTGHENTDRVLLEQYGTREACAPPFRQMMEAATKGGDEMEKKKIEDLYLPKAEYMYREGTSTLVPVDPEAAKVDHVMTRDGGTIFGIARVSKEPIPDGTTIRTEKTEDILLESFTGKPYEDAELDWQDPTPVSAAARAEAMAKIIGTGEVRTTSSTGGEKGMKPARFDLIPVMPLTKLAEHYGAGAAKYDEHQWRKGFELSKSYAAAQRHLTAFWGGEDNDPETGTPHLAAVTFHAFAMMQILQDFPQHDDRYKAEA